MPCGLWPLACCDCGFVSRRGHGCFLCCVLQKNKWHEDRGYRDTRWIKRSKGKKAKRAWTKKNVPVGARFSAPVQTGPGAHPAFCTLGTGCVSGEVKRTGRGVNRQPASSAEVKERVELHLYSPSGPSWPFLGKLYLTTKTKKRKERLF